MACRSETFTRYTWPAQSLNPEWCWRSHPAKATCGHCWTACSGCAQGDSWRANCSCCPASPRSCASDAECPISLKIHSAHLSAAVTVRRLLSQQRWSRDDATLDFASCRVYYVNTEDDVTRLLTDNCCDSRCWLWVSTCWGRATVARMSDSRRVVDVRLKRLRIQSCSERDIDIAIPPDRISVSVCPSVRHSPVLCRKG